MDLLTIQKLLGHHHLSTTSRYLHLVSTQWRPPTTSNPLDRLAAARHALKMPAPSPIALEAAEDFMKRVASKDIERCPCCGQGVLQVVAVLLPDRAAARRPHPALAALPACRGQPA